MAAGAGPLARHPPAVPGIYKTMQPPPKAGSTPAGALRIGTCSWKYDSWAGLVYSGSGKGNYLAEYARRYDTVEVDQWFWSLHGPGSVSLPKPETVREYADAVPEDFRFTVKVPNALTLTHFYRKNPAEPLRENPHFLSPGLFREFLERLAPLGPRLGPLMFQFEYLNRQKMPSPKVLLEKLDAFFAGCPREFPLAVELRNPHWLNAAWFDWLRERELGHVFLEGYYMPPAAQLYDRFADSIRGFTVIRLHGPDRPGMEEKSGNRWDRILEPRDGALDEAARIIRELRRREVDVFLNVNNHFEGCAPLTISRIRERL
jgi:uncharacterized protein YecE (DUF72 family)